MKIIDSWAVRFRCRQCGHRFIEYPPFALPHKRYVKLVLCERAQRALSASYRKAARADHGAAIGYQAREGPHVIDERQLSHTTRWRWLGWCGRQKPLLAATLELIRQKDPQASLFRTLFPIAPFKHRSEHRRQTLPHAARLLAARPVFARLFAGRDIFPHFATVHAPS